MAQETGEMISLEDYPELMTKEEVAKVLRLSPSWVPRLKGLKKTRTGNGRGRIMYLKVDVLEYIYSKRERKEVIMSANKQEKRHRKMGLPSLLSWEELQEAYMGYKK